NIVLPKEQQPNPYITPQFCFQFHYFAIRKMHFLQRARALVAFPGGFGTLDELFETLTLIQTKKAVQVPVILYDKAFWQKLINFDMLVEEGLIAAEDIALIQYADTPEQAWQLIADFYQLAR
ncbi:MAG TPA: 3-isopropylmalate dehydrogenase, partial [Rheinheimera sp.]|nr:3-isopropylmalate dehydrogenase [Rheinheimera sp.]